MREYKLFIVHEMAGIDRGTILELEKIPGKKGYFLPDAGKGESAFVEPAQLSPLPVFSENIPPAKCPVKVTSANLFENRDSGRAVRATVLESIHFQQLQVELPITCQTINTLHIRDRLKGYEHCNIEQTPTKNKDGKNVLIVEISYVPPGFYEIISELTRKVILKVTFIKCYPNFITNRYSTANQDTVVTAAEENENNSRKAKPVAADHEIMNRVLELVTQWGENFNKGINERISKQVHGLSHEDILLLIKLSREVESFIYAVCEDELAEKITEQDICEVVKAAFPWINESNLYRLKNIGMFYARK